MTSLTISALSHYGIVNSSTHLLVLSNKFFSIRISVLILNV